MTRILSILGLIALVALAAIAVALWSGTRGLSPSVLEAKYMSEADRFVDVAGLSVRVREEGPDEAPVLILMHGFIYSLETWDEWAAALSADYRVIRFDLAGHGLTGADPLERYAPDERAAFVGDVMNALHIEHAVIGGNSLGGLAAWRFAAKNPERVDGLILVDPGAYSINGVTETPVTPPEPVKLFLRTAPEAAVRASLGRVYADPRYITDDKVVLIRDMMRRRGNGEAFVKSIEEFTLPDPTAALASISSPTLILWGASDAMIPVEHGALMEAAMPNARLVLIDGAGHAPQEEASVRSAEEARRFLAALREEGE
jgi:pimeloyl-ACP methyl ester carboxylesterase